MIKGAIYFVDSSNKEIMTTYMTDPLPCHRGDTVKLESVNYYIHHVDWVFEKGIPLNQYLHQTVIVSTDPPIGP